MSAGLVVSLIVALVLVVLGLAAAMAPVGRSDSRPPARNPPPARMPPAPNGPGFGLLSQDAHCLELPRGVRFEMLPVAKAVADAMKAADELEGGICFPHWEPLPRTSELIPYARAGTVALLEQFSDPLVLRCIGLECLGSYALETLTRGLHKRHLRPDESRKLQEAIDVGVAPERLADIVDHQAFHDARQVWLEKQANVFARERRHVDQSSVETSPDAVAFGLDEHAWPLPYGPSDACLAAYALRKLVHVLEALSVDGAGRWVRDQESQRRLRLQYIANEREHVVSDDGRCDQHSVTPGVCVVEGPKTAAALAAAMVRNAENAGAAGVRP